MNFLDRLVSWRIAGVLVLLRPASSLSTHTRSVAVIGGGVASLSFAQRLTRDGSQLYNVTVFDTGRLRPGGRCSSRLPGDPPKDGADSSSFPLLNKQVVDHAAQMSCVPQGRKSEYADFAQQIEVWEEAGVVTRFPATCLYEIQKPKDSGNDVQLKALDNAQDFFHGTNGMGSITRAMAEASNFNIHQDVWISPSGGVRYSQKRKQWSVQTSSQHYGYYDCLIIGHNGKCADRLMSKTPARKVHSLLRVNFAPNVAAHGGKRMTLNSIYSLTVALKAPSPLATALPESFISGFIRNEPSLRFVTNQSRKYPSQESDGVEVWTILSSPTFAKKHKAAQEFLSDEAVEEVSTLLLQGLERSLNLPPSSIRVLERRLQLWGAALPVNTWQNGSGFIYDAENAVGVCGDWLVEPSIAGAWTSGNKLAEYMLLQGSKPKESIGLEGSFRRVAKNDIGLVLPAPKRSLATVVGKT